MRSFAAPSSSPKLTPIAGFFLPYEKASFAKALLAAIQAAKRGISYNPIT